MAESDGKQEKRFFFFLVSCKHVEFVLCACTYVQGLGFCCAFFCFEVL